MNQREYRTLILASLLHDVGKFVQKPTGRSRDHPEESARFIENSAEALLRWDVDATLLLNLLRYHQGGSYRDAIGSDQLPVATLLSQADHYSSGERTPEYREDTGQIRGYMPLESSFADVDLGFEPTAPKSGYRPRSLHPTRAFPELPPGEHIDAAEIRQTIADFASGFERILLQSSSFDIFFHSLLTLLERYTWATPSDVSRPDISIFDHLRTTCALTACLALFHDAQATLYDLGAVENEEVSRLLLVEGSLSGIQSYLYGITSIGQGGVAKRLRARSFFLTALVDIVAHRLLRELLAEQVLPPVCRIMSKGGRFTLLLPNLPEVTSSLQRLKREINSWLLREFHGDIAFTFAYTAMAGRDFGLGGIGTKFRILEEAHREEKARRLSAVLVNDGAWTPEPFVQQQVRYTPGAGACRSCNKLPAEERYGYLCPQCDHQRQLSERLLTARYLAYSCGESSPDPQRTFSFFEGDTRYYVTLADTLDQVPMEPKPFLVEGLPDPASEALIEAAWEYPYADRYIANYVARFQDRQQLENLCARCPESERSDVPCAYRDQALQQLQRRGTAMYSFSCIAAESTGRPLIGLLKADADRLGALFGQGLWHRDSLSRRATLSRMVDLFFGGRVDHLLATESQASYVVYSGGDDLLIVGPWDKLIHVARRINTEFHRFTAGNGNLTMSAGLAFVKPRYPIARAVEHADNALEDSKTGNRDVRGAWRDRLTVLGHTLRWADLTEVMEVIDALGEAKPTSAFLYHLSYYAYLYQRYLHDGDATRLRYKSLLAYDIARNVRARNPALHRWACGLMESLHSSDPQSCMDHLELVARYVQFARRGGEL